MNIRAIALPAALLLTLASLSVFHLAPVAPSLHATPALPAASAPLSDNPRPIVTLEPIIVTPSAAERAEALRSS